MRMMLAVLIGLTLTDSAWAQAGKDAPPFKRPNLDPDLEQFPQATDKEALASVVKAIELKRITYLVLHLVDPDWVKQRVQQEHHGQLEGLVKEITAKLVDDPSSLKELRHYRDEGEWEETDTSSAVRLKNAKDQVFFRKVGKRWFMENRKKGQQ